MRLPSGDHAGWLENSSGLNRVIGAGLPLGSLTTHRSLSKSGPNTRRPVRLGLASAPCRAVAADADRDTSGASTGGVDAGAGSGPTGGAPRAGDAGGAGASTRRGAMTGG